jgi:two-component system chemotaxis response regulator CheB
MPDAVKKIRVLIVEDTMVGRNFLSGLLKTDPRFDIVAMASDGKEAVDMVPRYQPDVVSMDFYMPVMDGIEATRLIMHQNPVPIVVVSSFYTPLEVAMSFKVIEAGAVTIIPKPFGPGHPRFNESAQNFRNILSLMAELKVGRRKATPVIKPVTAQTTTARNTPQVLINNDVAIIAIGASAGGPEEIRKILSSVPSTLDIPILVVQHIDPSFAQGFCEWLSLTVKLPVRIASDGESLRPGNVYFPPGDHHIGLANENTILVSQSPPEKGLRPSVNFMFRTVNACFGKNVMAILLSGMGSDGAQEMLALRNAGALTIAQDKNGCLIHGMPGEAIKIGAAVKILTTEEIIREIIMIKKTVNL